MVLAFLQRFRLVARVVCVSYQKYYLRQRSWHCELMAEGLDLLDEVAARCDQLGSAEDSSHGSLLVWSPLQKESRHRAQTAPELGSCRQAARRQGGQLSHEQAERAVDSPKAVSYRV